MLRFAVAAALAAPVVVAAAVPAAAQSFAPLDAGVPQPPAGAAAGFVPPERDTAGYVTPNRGAAAGEAAWHVRVALNVAALGCREAGDLAAAYNAFLAAERAPLAAANEETRGAYRTRYAAAWEARFDDDMTRLYNYFAQPPAQAGFCRVAAALLDEAKGVAPEQFAAFAAAALPRLEAPFVAFFAAYDDYRGALATWRLDHQRVVIATAAPAPVGPRPPIGPDGD